MSELKAVHAFDVYEAYTKTGDDDAAQVYIKSEADKAIAKLEKKLDIYKRGWMENDKVNANQYAEIRHHKYKRCLAMANYWVAVSYHCVDDEHRQKAERHHRKWLELAEKFKE